MAKKQEILDSEELNQEELNQEEVESIEQEIPPGFVVMRRDPEIYSAPYEVAVPPSEVENYQSGGYEPV